MGTCLAMPRSGARVLLAGRTRRERQQLRAGISLRSFTISDATRRRYEAAVGLVLPFLEEHGLVDCDQLVSEWIECQWVRGESVNVIADCLSGLHFFLPEIRGSLRQSWRLFRSWRRVETPCRAPPLTPELVKAMIARAVDQNHIAFATMLAIEFHALLRTGELLALQFQDVEFADTCGVITLKSSKSGLRHGTEEAVALRDGLTLSLLETLFSVQEHGPGNKLWPFSAQCFRETFQKYLRFFRLSGLSFKPYSLRRGGATFLLQSGTPLDVILLRGRWHSLSVARLYLEDGMAQIPAIRIPPEDRPRIAMWAAHCPKTAFRP